MQDAIQAEGQGTSKGRTGIVRREMPLTLALIGLHAVFSWPTLYLYSRTADVPAVYLASGVVLAGFLLLGRNAQILFAAGVFVSQLVGEFVVYSSPVAVALVFSASKTLEGVLAAWLLRRVTGRPGLAATARALAAFGAIACVVVPLVMALPPQLVKVVYFDTAWSAYLRWALLQACGIAVMAPVLLYWLQPRGVRISDYRAEPLFITLAALAVFVGVFIAPPAASHQHSPFYAATPVMIWAAVRFGCRGAALMNLALTLLMIGAALGRFGPFHDLSDLELSVIELQLFILVVTGTTLLLGAYAEARETSRQQRATDKRRLQDLSLRLLESEERYRDRLATRLHDGVGQTLSLGRMRLDDVLMPPVNPDTLASRLAPVQNAFDIAISQVRDMTRDVAVGLYRGDDIAAAVHQHMSSIFDGSGVDTTVHSDALPQLSHEVAVVASRAIRECLVNVAKHAGASLVRVDLGIAPRSDQLTAVITDNGCGFDVSALDMDAEANTSFGLASVRNSMLALGGTFEIVSTVGSGTRIVLTLPRERVVR